MKDILKWARASADGKPVPFTIDFRDGSPPASIMMPLKNKARTSRRSGAPRHPLTVERVKREAGAHPDHTDHQLAARLTATLRAELGPGAPVVTKSLVRRRRREGGILRPLSR